MSNPDSIISMEALCKTYHSAGLCVPVLNGVDLDIRNGEFVAIMGQSGSGKSTLMNVIGCLDVFDSGRYEFAGTPVDKLLPAELAALRSKHIGFVFQSFNLVPQISALRNVELPLIYGSSGRKARLLKAMEMLERVGLADRADHKPSQLSGGQQQRVAIARALVNEPDLIVADEPTGSLDSQTGADIMSQLAQVNGSGTTVLLVTHEAEIAAHAERHIRIVDGRTAHQGRKQISPDHSASVQLSASLIAHKRYRRRRDSLPDILHVASGASRLSRHGQSKKRS